MLYGKAVPGDQCPAVAFLLSIRGFGGQERLDGYHRIFLEPGFVGAVVIAEDFMRGLMQAFANAMTGQISDHFVARFFGFGLDQAPNVGQSYPAFDLANCFG